MQLFEHGTKLLRCCWVLLALNASCHADSVYDAASRDDPDVTQVGEREYRLKRERLDAALSWLAHDRGCRVVPAEEDGKTVGVKLYGVRQRALLGQLGFQNGDVVRDVNGISLATAEGALRVRNSLRGDNRVEVNLKRRDHAVTLVVWLTPRRAWYASQAPAPLL